MMIMSIPEHLQHGRFFARIPQFLTDREALAQEGHRLPELTTVWVPESLAADTDEAALRRILLQRYSIEIGGGLGPVAGKVWRIGCMGHTARHRNVTMLLGALRELLAA